MIGSDMGASDMRNGMTVSHISMNSKKIPILSQNRMINRNSGTCETNNRNLRANSGTTTLAAASVNSSAGNCGGGKPAGSKYTFTSNINQNNSSVVAEKSCHSRNFS